MEANEDFYKLLHYKVPLKGKIYNEKKKIFQWRMKLVGMLLKHVVEHEQFACRYMFHIG